MSLQARFGKVLHVSTRHGEAAGGGGSSASRRSSERPRGIRRPPSVGNFAEVYDMGKEVMPSTHSYMKVNFATRRKDGQEVVVKVRYKPNCFRSREDERSWRHNTEFLLNMPESFGVARLYEVLEDPKAFYVVMERVHGLDLFETLEAEGRVPPQTAREILRQLLHSLAHLHAHNAVHKDLKLENVMMEGAGAGGRGTAGPVKVIDFDTLEEWTPASPVCKDVVGTDQYIAQEAYGGKYSPLSDIFATGVIAFRLLSGRFPYHDGMFDDETGENWVGSPKMVQIRRRLKVAKVDFSHPVFREHPEATDLIISMLAYDERQRPTAAAALEHPWFLQDAAAEAGPGSSKMAAPGRHAPAGARCDFEDLIDDGIIIAD